MRHKKKDGLESKVKVLANSDIKTDSIGRYIPICDYSFHRGVIKREYVCIRRQCQYYKKLYFPKI